MNEMNSLISGLGTWVESGTIYGVGSLGRVIDWETWLEEMSSIWAVMFEAFVPSTKCL